MMNALPHTDPSPLSASESIAKAAVTETQNMQNAIQENRNALPASPADTLKTASPIATPVSPANSPANSEVSSAPKTSIETSSRIQMAAVLKLNAARGMFTINLSSGHERTLYAFLDPTCSVCRTMEPAIERLAQEFNVIVFPVSVVNDVNNGGNAVEKIAPLLCQTDSAKRASGWLALFRADAGMSLPGNNVSAPDNTECEKSAAAAVAVNDYAFRQFGFKGTPWVVTDTGFRLPTGLLAEPAKIDLFLKTTDSMAPEQADSFLKTVIPQE
ncbi:thioredoxin domain-containing protein [Pectobacterium atrosepticum]|uniref:DsbC family protein n=2 Tax=Pectobacterium atrosepticum TaxID=29471 RepID=UPI00128C9962|nr:DsbC family protein [Pectobacterium atrosepticum]